jgi:hypothetical protein
LTLLLLFNNQLGTNIAFNGIGLSPYLVTPGVSGVHDMPPAVVSRQFIPGSSLPSDTIQRRDLPTLNFNCVVVGDDHDDLVSTLKTLKPLISPELGWCTFWIKDRPLERTWAFSRGLPIKIDQLPYLTDVVEFQWSLDRYPWWEDIALTTATDPASITNSGDLETWPIYTCTVINAMAGGLHFHVGSLAFTYSGDLDPADVLVIDAEAMTCKLNGTLDMANVLSTTDFPSLAVGVNTISKSSADYTLAVAYRERKE